MYYLIPVNMGESSPFYPYFKIQTVNCSTLETLITNLPFPNQSSNKSKKEKQRRNSAHLILNDKTKYKKKQMISPTHQQEKESFLSAENR